VDPFSPQPALGLLCAAIVRTPNPDQGCRTFLRSPTATQLLAWHLGSAVQGVVEAAMSLLRALFLYSSASALTLPPRLLHRALDACLLAAFADQMAVPTALD
jgi:hypothetical protein